MKYNYTLDDIETNLPRKSWWAMIMILPFARRVSLFLINRSDIKPNTITFSSFILAIFASLFYIQGTHYYLIIASILFELNYLLDCVDGSVARVKAIQSPIGAYLDKMCDRVRILILTIALCYGQWKSTHDVTPVILGIVYLGMNNLIIISRSIQKRVLDQFELGAETGVELVSKSTSDDKINGPLSRWLKLTYERNIMPYWHDVESDALVFFIGPIFNMPILGLILGIFVAASAVILLNVPFVASISRRPYEQPNN